MSLCRQPNHGDTNALWQGQLLGFPEVSRDCEEEVPGERRGAIQGQVQPKRKTGITIGEEGSGWPAAHSAETGSASRDSRGFARRPGWTVALEPLLVETATSGWSLQSFLFGSFLSS